MYMCVYVLASVYGCFPHVTNLQCELCWKLCVFLSRLSQMFQHGFALSCMHCQQLFNKINFYKKHICWDSIHIMWYIISNAQSCSPVFVQVNLSLFSRLRVISMQDHSSLLYTCITNGTVSDHNYSQLFSLFTVLIGLPTHPSAGSSLSQVSLLMVCGREIAEPWLLHQGKGLGKASVKIYTTGISFNNSSTLTVDKTRCKEMKHWKGVYASLIDW